MRRLGFVLWFLLALGLANGSAQASRLSHAIVLVGNIDSARKSFAQAGFSVTPARAIDNGLVHAIVPFADGTFLELLGASPRSPYANAIARFASSGAAFSAAGYEVGDVAAERARLLGLGFGLEPLDFETHWIDLDFSDTRLFNPFFIFQYRNQPPESYRQRYAAYLHHPNGANGLRGIIVAAEPQSGAAAAYARAGLTGVTVDERGAGDARIVVAELATSDPERKGSRLSIDRCRFSFR